MRPQVDGETAEVLEQLADELTEVDTEMLTFDQRLRVVLKKVDDIETTTGSASTERATKAGRIIGQL